MGLYFVVGYVGGKRNKYADRRVGKGQGTIGGTGK